MRKYFLYATLLAVFAIISCEKLSVASDESEGFADITFSLQPQVSESMTRATLSSTVTKFDFAIFYKKDNAYTLYKTIQQESTDDSFGVISLEKVPYGSYKVVAIGHKCTVHATIKSDSEVDFGGDKVPVTFSVAKEITVNADSQNYNLELKRIFSTFILKATDTQPGTLASLEWVITGSSFSFDPATGCSSTTVERTKTIDITAGAHRENMGYSIDLFLPAAESKVTVVAKFKDSEGAVVSTKTFTDVQVKLNCVTTCKGELFSSLTNTGGFSFTVDDKWQDPITVSF